MSEKRAFAAVSEVGRQFWAACAEQRFTLPQCSGCGRLRWYLLPACPRCYTAGYEWAALSGAAKLYSYTIVHRAFDKLFEEEIPYVTAFVTPVEDPDVRFVTRVVDSAPERVVVGMDMVVAFTDVRGVLMPFFRPA